MRVLLDTNVLLWWLGGDPRVTPYVPTIADPRNEVYFSSVSAVEISLKVSLGKLVVPAVYLDTLRRQGIEELAVTARHGQAVADLPWHHRDPFDRMLIAQALTEGWPVLTSDRIFRRYGLRVLPDQPA